MPTEQESTIQDPAGQAGVITEGVTVVEPPLVSKLNEPVANEPNIIFVGTRRVHSETERLEEAPATLTSGYTAKGPNIFDNLPSSEEQIDGFYYERAAELCRAFPGLYKRLIKKGD